jgi:hypothetical protein
MSILINDNFNVALPKSIDSRYGPFDDVETALAAIPSWKRFLGLTAGVGTSTITEYWFSGGIDDIHFVPKIDEGGAADKVEVDTTNFDNILNPLDINVQLALETLNGHTHPFSTITDKPTTLDGYGITDPIVLESGMYSNPTWLVALAWAKMTGTPTTLAGYGITDEIVLESESYSNPSWLTALAWAKITGTPTSLAGYGISDDIILGTSLYSNPSWITSLAWAKLTGTPTTLSGYGITDPIVVTTGSYSNPAWITSLAWSKITSTPTTIAGYGITNAENTANKTTDVTLGGVSPSSTKYTSEYAVKTYVDNQIAAAQAGIPTFEIDMFANYKIYESDEAGTTTYVGTIKATNGNWLITKYVDNNGDITATYANESNNATYTTPTSAWTNRASLSYTAINNLTDI